MTAKPRGHERRGCQLRRGLTSCVEQGLYPTQIGMVIGLDGVLQARVHLIAQQGMLFQKSPRDACNHVVLVKGGDILFVDRLGIPVR